MHREPTYDVLIAGAGPAGTHTALRLAREGWRVGLLDAREFPRKKPCGEFLSPACLPLLSELGLLGDLRRSGAAEVAGMHLVAPGSRTRGQYLPMGPFAAPHGHGLGIRREVLDALAVDAARREERIDVRLGWSVSGVVLDERGRPRGLSVRTPEGRRTELTSRFVVGADGRNSRVARGLGWSRPRTGTDRFAVVARFEGVADREEAGVHFVGRDYFAACPIDGGAFTANLVVDADDLPKGRVALERFFRERLAQAPDLEARIGDAPLSEPMAPCGPLATRVARCAGDGAALVGDACGFVDPLTGEGLFFAMQGARLLSDALAVALQEPRRERAALRSYAWARRRELGPRYALARLLQRGLRRPGVPERVLGTLARIPALMDLLLGLTGDYVPPRGLVLPSVWRSALGRERVTAS